MHRKDQGAFSKNAFSKNAFFEHAFSKNAFFSQVLRQGRVRRLWRLPLNALRATRLEPLRVEDLDRELPALRSTAPVMLSCHGIRQTLEGSFSAVSKPNFASKYALESSRRDLHNALLCTVLVGSVWVKKYTKINIEKMKSGKS